MGQQKPNFETMESKRRQKGKKTSEHVFSVCNLPESVLFALILTKIL